LVFTGGGAVGKGKLHLIKDNNFILSANNVKPILSFWSINNSNILENVKPVLPAKVNALAVSPNGSDYVVAGIKENIYIWQLATGKMLTMLSKHYQNVNCIKFTEDGSHFISAGDDGQVIIWSLSASMGDQYKIENVEPLHVISDHALSVTDLWIGSGGVSAILMTSSKDRSVKLYDIASGSLLMSIVSQEIITSIVLNRIETSIFAGTSLGNIYHYSLQTPPRSREYHITDDDKIKSKFSGHSKSITCLALSIDDQILMSGSEDCSVILWNIQSKSILKAIQLKGSITNAIFMTNTQTMFDREIKLELIAKNFHRMISNSDEKELKDTIKVCQLNDVKNLENHNYFMSKKKKFFSFECRDFSPKQV
jgi:pre-rRNA-processing protein IPI3